VDVGKATTAGAAINLNARLKASATSGNMSANSNLCLISNNADTRFIFDAEGSGHSDVEWTTYAEHDDLSLVADMEQELLLHEDEAKTERRHMLEQAGIIGKDSWHMEEDRLHVMVNFTKLAMLHHGALIQAAGRIETLETKLLALQEAK
jgi:hypothetical protein